MLLSVLVLCLFLAAGVLLARRLVPAGSSFALVLPLGCAIALALLEALPALFALVFGFRLPAVLASLTVAIALGFWAALGGTSLRIKPDKSDFAFVCCLVPMLVISYYLLYTHVLCPEADGSLWCGQSTYGDLPMHLAFIKSIAVGGVFPPHYSLLAGQTVFGYPFLCESVSSVFLLLGASLRGAYCLPELLAFVAVYGMGWQLARTVLQSARKATLAFWLFFMGSGFGFVYFLGSKERFLSIFSGFYTTPTNDVTHNIRWVNPLADLLIPQRATLFGWALLFPCLYLLVRFALHEEQKLWLPLALLAGCLPLVHTHSLLALVLVSAALFLRALLAKQPALLPRWLGYAALAGALCLPQLCLVIFRQTGSGEHFLRWQWNWANDGDSFFWFYIKNIGLVYLLLIPAFFHAPKKLRWLYGGGLAIQLVSECIVFQPNPYDNNKLLFIWHLLGCLLVADFLWDMLAAIRQKPLRIAAGTLAVFLATFGSVLTLGREAVSKYQQFDADGVALGAYVDEALPADALFLTGMEHLNPVASLAGRQIVCGSTLYVYYHGMKYSEQAGAIKALYETPDEALLALWGVDYVLISGWERSDYLVDEAFYAARYPVVFQQGQYSLYQITTD